HGRTQPVLPEPAPGGGFGRGRQGRGQGMTPLYFGDRSRRLFGVYSPGHAGAGRARGAVLCAPWGPEYLRAHRSLAQLGKWLNEAGVHVLRFDWYGTGDSAGDMSDARLDGWLDDLGQAIDELRDTA